MGLKLSAQTLMAILPAMGLRISSDNGTGGDIWIGEISVSKLTLARGVLGDGAAQPDTHATLITKLAIKTGRIVWRIPPLILCESLELSEFQAPKVIACFSNRVKRYTNNSLIIL
jgi:hypothetical protein